MEKESINLLSKNNVIVHSKLISMIGEDDITSIGTKLQTIILLVDLATIFLHESNVGCPHKTKSQYFQIYNHCQVQFNF